MSAFQNNSFQASAFGITEAVVVSPEIIVGGDSSKKSRPRWIRPKTINEPEPKILDVIMLGGAVAGGYAEVTRLRIRTFIDEGGAIIRGSADVESIRDETELYLLLLLAA